MAVTVPAWGAQSNRPERRPVRRSVGKSVSQPGARDRRHQRVASSGPVRVVGGARLPRSSHAARTARLQSRPSQSQSRARRNASHKRNAVIGGLAFLVAALILFLPGLSAEASRGAPESSAQSVVTVRAGDSLWTVAQRSMPDTDTRSAVIELRKANGLRGSDLTVGQQLVVPSR